MYGKMGAPICVVQKKGLYLVWLHTLQAIMCRVYIGEAYCFDDISVLAVVHIMI